MTFEEGLRQLSVSVESMGALTAEVTGASGVERAVVLDSSGSKVKSATEKGLTTFQATNGGTYTILYVGVDAVKNGSSVNVSYRAEAAGVQVIALYDASGRMLDAETRSGAASGAWMVTLTGANGTEVRVFQRGELQAAGRTVAYNGTINEAPPHPRGSFLQAEERME